MKLDKFECDRCKAVVDGRPPMTFYAARTSMDSRTKDKDICRSCVDDLMRWIEAGV